MARAVVPAEMPAVPEKFARWRRSLRRGSIYHLTDFLGAAACSRHRRFERYTSEGPRHLGDMQYWGVCPRCLAKSKKAGE
jgi:hypothetical protein